MATEEKSEEPKKDIKDKVIETNDVKNVSEKVVEEEKKNNEVEKGEVQGIELEGVKNVGEAGESKTDEGVIEKEGVEEKKSEDETREIVGEDKSKESEAEEAVSEEKKNNDLKEYEKRALMDLKSKIETAILENKLFKRKKDQVVGHEKEKILEKEGGEKEKKIENEGKGEENAVKEAEKEKETSEKVEEIGEKDKILEKEAADKEKINEGKVEKNSVTDTEKEKESSKKIEDAEIAKPSEGEKLAVKEEKEDCKENKPSKQEDEEKEKKAEESQKENDNVTIDQERKVDVIDEDITIWGVPLLPSKGDDSTDVILLKFLRAREFEVNDAFKMLRNTLQWRKDNNVDSILDEDFGEDLGSIGQMNGVGREGHPVCYSNFKLLGDEGLYNKILGTEENREMFIRRRVQLMEKAIHKLDFKPDGMSSILLVNDLKDMPGPSKKELRFATRQVVGLLQDNYPEFVARNIFINVPFWYYAYSASALLFPFLTPRTNSKVVYARPSRVTDVLLKYIAAEELPVHYGGLKQENDSDFSTEDAASEIVVYQSSSESIHLPTPEAGTTLIWEVTVLGWEVNYKEEFFPTDEGSYGIIIQKGRRVGWQEGSLRNSFTNNEPGNIVLTIENGSLIKKKRVCYRHKIKNSSS